MFISAFMINFAVRPLELPFLFLVSGIFVSFRGFMFLRF